MRRRALAITIALLAALALGRQGPVAQAVQFLWADYRAWAHCRDLSRVEGPHFFVLYPSGYEAEARLILRLAERGRSEVARVFGSEPRGKIRVILHPSPDDMAAMWRWPGGRTAAGAYLGGTLSVLAGGSEAELYGVLVHEITHLFVDELGRGRSPRWLSEGLAQLLEAELAGPLYVAPVEIAWPPPDSGDWRPLDALFADPRRQDEAYLRSLVLASRLVDELGHGGVAAVLEHMGRGMSFEGAFKRVSGTAWADQLDLWARQRGEGSPGGREKY